MTAALELIDASLTIGDAVILDRVNLRIDAGEIVGLVGRSGSGKSMTALAAMRLAPAGSRLSGAIRLNGENMLDKSETQMCALRGREIAMVFQEPMTALNPLHTVGAQVAEAILIHSDKTKDAALAEARDVLRRVGLAPETVSPSRFPHELSGGQRQRAVIAMAIAMKPKALIADEPTTALDVTTQAEILALLKRLAAEDAMALLLITHDLAVVSNMADRIAVMKDGRVVDDHSPEDFFRRGLSNEENGLIAHPVARRKNPDAAESRQAILKARNAVCEYAVPKRTLFSRTQRFRAVDGVSFALRKGENLGLVGESGCGKSTLARTLLGLQTTAEGRIEIDGAVFPTKEKAAMRRMRRNIQIVFQDPYASFNPRHRIKKIIAEPFRLFDAPPGDAERNERISDALTAVDLSPDDAHKFPHEFSGGQRQRIAIARALITEPAVIILDEATSALDITSRNRVLELLMRLSEERDVSYLFITHDLTVIRDVADRVLVMKNGRIIEEGPTKTVFENPEHEYTQALINAAPKIKWPRSTSA